MINNAANRSANDTGEIRSANEATEERHVDDNKGETSVTVETVEPDDTHDPSTVAARGVLEVPGYVFEDDLFLFCPLHNDKVAHVDMAGASCWLLCVGELSCSTIINLDLCGSSLFKV